MDYFSLQTVTRTIYLLQLYVANRSDKFAIVQYCELWWSTLRIEREKERVQELSEEFREKQERTKRSIVGEEKWSEIVLWRIRELWDSSMATNSIVQVESVDVPESLQVFRHCTIEKKS